MKIILTNKGKEIIVDDEDYDYLSKYTWYLHPQGYATKDPSDKSSPALMHRLILRPLKGQLIDHKNGNKLDNRKDNLRLCDYKQNAGNSKPLPGKVRYRGVSLEEKSKVNPYRAYININRRYVFLGNFKTAEEAALAYNEAAIEHFGEFATLNIVGDI